MWVEYEEDFLWEKEKSKWTKEEEECQAERGSVFKEFVVILSLVYLRNLKIISMGDMSLGKLRKSGKFGDKHMAKWERLGQEFGLTQEQGLGWSPGRWVQLCSLMANAQALELDMRGCKSQVTSC